MKIEQPIGGRRMVFNSCSGLDSLQLQRENVHNVEHGELLGSVSFSQAPSEEPPLDVQNEESSNNNSYSFEDHQSIEKSEEKQQKCCDGCVSRDYELEKLRFENSLLKDAIVNLKKTIAALEMQVKQEPIKG